MGELLSRTIVTLTVPGMGKFGSHRRTKSFQISQEGWWQLRPGLGVGSACPPKQLQSSSQVGGDLPSGLSAETARRVERAPQPAGEGGHLSDSSSASPQPRNPKNAGRLLQHLRKCVPERRPPAPSQAEGLNMTVCF